MQVIISGDVNRPGQDPNIYGLASKIGEHIQDAFHEPPLVIPTDPLPFKQWAQTYDIGPFPAMGDGLVIGFELPPCAKAELPWWVDVRRSPIRFIDDIYSLTSNIPGFADIIEKYDAGPIPVLPAPIKDPGLGVFALQVHNDAALLKDGKFLGPWHYRERIAEWARELDHVVISPHPMQPRSPWLKGVRSNLLKVLPENGITVRKVRGPEDSIYPVLSMAAHVLVVSSSVGAEAPFFRCKPTFLWKEPDYVRPIYLDEEGLWRDVAELCLSHIPD